MVITMNYSGGIWDGMYDYVKWKQWGRFFFVKRDDPFFCFVIFELKEDMVTFKVYIKVNELSGSML